MSEEQMPVSGDGEVSGQEGVPGDEQFLSPDQPIPAHEREIEPQGDFFTIHVEDPMEPLPDLPQRTAGTYRRPGAPTKPVTVHTRRSHTTALVISLVVVLTAGAFTGLWYSAHRPSAAQSTDLVFTEIEVNGAFVPPEQFPSSLETSDSENSVMAPADVFNKAGFSDFSTSPEGCATLEYALSLLSQNEDRDSVGWTSDLIISGPVSFGTDSGDSVTQQARLFQTQDDAKAFMAQLANAEPDCSQYTSIRSGVESTATITKASLGAMVNPTVAYSLNFEDQILTAVFIQRGNAVMQILFGVPAASTPLVDVSSASAVYDARISEMNAASQ